MIDFIKKYVIRIYSIILIMLAICEICFIGIYKQNNAFMCINIALNFVFSIIGFLFSLNPFYNFNFNYDDFWKFETVNTEGYDALRTKLFKSTAFVIINSIGIALSGDKFIPLFVAEIIINFLPTTLLILKFAKIYFSSLFFPTILPIVNPLENSNPANNHFMMYYLRYIAIWTYLLCGYEIFATYKINQNDVCRSRGSISVVILNLIVNFIIGTILVIEPLNKIIDQKIKSLFLTKILLISIPTILIYVSTGCPNSYLTGVFILETGLHMILPICIFSLVVIVCLLGSFVICLCQGIMSVGDLADLADPADTPTLPQNELIEPINLIQPIQSDQLNEPNQSSQSSQSNQSSEPSESSEPFLAAKSIKKNNFVIVNKFSNDICAICQGHIDKTQQYAVLNCSHDYHEDCIKLLDNKQKGIKCPLCSAITNNDIV